MLPSFKQLQGRRGRTLMVVNSYAMCIECWVNLRYESFQRRDGLCHFSKQNLKHMCFLQNSCNPRSCDLRCSRVMTGIELKLSAQPWPGVWKRLGHSLPVKNFVTNLFWDQVAKFLQTISSGTGYIPKTQAYWQVRSEVWVVQTCCLLMQRRCNVCQTLALKIELCTNLFAQILSIIAYTFNNPGNR